VQIEASVPNQIRLLRFRDPEVSLASARTKRRNFLVEGKDPSAQKKLDKVAADVNVANTFGAVAAESTSPRRKHGA